MRRRLTWIVLAVVVLTMAGGGWYWLRVRKAATAAVPEGETVTAKRGTVRKTVSADGVLRPLTTVEVKSYAGGAVNVLAVDVGDSVKAGELIAVIDPTDSRTAHQQALADLSVASANLAKARAQLRVQSTLTAADIAQAQSSHTTATVDLARLRDATQPRTRAEARAAVDQAQAALDVAVKDLERIRNADHPQARVEAEAAVARYTAALEAADKELERLRTAQLPKDLADARAALERSKAARESARRNLDRLREASHPQARVQAESGLAKARSDLDVASKELERARALREKGLISQSELDATQSAYEAKRADFAYAEELATTLGSEQQSELSSTELAIVQAEADLSAAEERWRTLEQQQSAELQAAEAKQRQAAADLAAASERWATLEDQQAAELRVAEAKVAQARASLASAEERWRILDREQQTEAEAAASKVTGAEAALHKAEAQAVETELRQAEVASAQAQVQKAEAQVRNAAIMLGYTTITAPRDGVILQRFVEEGTIITSGRSAVTSGTTIVELGDLTRMFVDVQVDESDLANVSVGQAVDVRVEAYGDATIEGVVTRLDPQAVTTQNVTTVKVEVEIVHPDKTLLPGLTASCDFLVAEVKDVVYVPRRAVDVTDQGATVRVVVNGKTIPTPVTVGLRGDEATEILEGLEEGQEVFLPRLGTGVQMGQSRGREMGRQMGGGGFTPSRPPGP